MAHDYTHSEIRTRRCPDDDESPTKGRVFVRTLLTTKIDERTYTHGWDPTLHIVKAESGEDEEKIPAEVAEIGGTQYVFPLPGMPAFKTPFKPTADELRDNLDEVAEHWFQQITEG